MWNKLCEPDHLIIIILVLLVALLVVGAGKGGGKLLLQLLKRVFGREEVNINLTGGDMGGNISKKAVFCEPEKCMPLAAVKQQQQTNIKDIAGLGGQLHVLTDLFFKKLNFIKQQNDVILRAMMKNNQLNESDIPKESP